MRTKTRRLLVLLALVGSAWGCQPPPKPAPEVAAEPPQEILFPSVENAALAQAPVAGPAAPTVAPENAPKIVAVQALHDFGRVKQGTEVVHVFKIRNEGKSDLMLSGASSS